MKSNLRCEFDWIEITEDIVFIRDLNNGRRSVTNDAEEVYRWINQIAYPGRRVVYQDSEGEWSEMLPIENWMGKTIGFRPWNGRVWDILSNESI